MSAVVRNYYLTEKAYGSLVGMAQRQGYVKWGSEKAKGLSEFLSDLALFPCEDTRPELIVMRHKEEIAHNRAPTWLHTRVRRGRPLKLTEDAIARYFKVAFEVGIITAEPYIVGGPSRTSPVPSVAYVLEAIGLGWITPESMPKRN